ncbi:uncharacterized protein [Amphiura filiformis]|uniref:uncharacterized protein n=1 Tax=Amphiura filiformis TaxID=82378 RepID=UPI003B223C9C
MRSTMNRRIGANINRRIGAAEAMSGKTQLHSAVEKSAIAQCRLLVEAGEDLDARDEDDQSALDIAVWNGDAAITRLLITAGASITYTNQSKQTSFRLAAEYLFNHMQEMKAKSNKQPDFDARSLMEDIGAPTVKDWRKRRSRMVKQRHKKPTNVVVLEQLLQQREQGPTGGTEEPDEDYEAFFETFRVFLVSGADPNTFWDPESHQTLLSKAAQEGYVEPCKLLLLAGADPNILDGLLNTALHSAMQRDNEEVCKLLLISETEIHAINQMGRTALHLAAHRNCPGICELLVRQGASPCIEDESGQSPILIAVTGGHYESTQVLLESLQVDIGHKYENFEQRTLLHLASNDGHADICELLVDTFGGVSYINDGDKDLRTPLHLAAMGNHRTTCNLLLSKNADITAIDKDKLTPLHHAAKENNDVVLKILLAKARDNIQRRDRLLQFVNATTDDGNTALHFAMKKAKQDVYEPLIAFGADPFIKNQTGMSPFLVAVQNAKSDDLHIVFELLLHYSYHITSLTTDEDLEGNTALHIAARKDKKDICESLVNRYGTDVTAKNKNDYVPLHFAATLKRPGICQFLLDKYQNLIGAKGKDGVTPLHMAAQRGSDKVCKFLLEHGSEVNVEDQAGDTPLHYAARRGDDKICAALVKCGADALAANKNGDIPEDGWPEENRSAAKTLKRERRNQADEELMKTGERPVEVVKLLLVGHPEAGKTTLKNSMDQEKYMVDRSSYIPTPGITVERKPVGTAGQFSVWDCAGQMEYHVTHGMFLGAQNAIILVVYDLFREVYGSNERRAKLQQQDEIYYWLAFVKAVNRCFDGKKPQVALVATHFDIIPEDRQDYYRNLAAKNVRQAVLKFGSFLDISKDVFILGMSFDMTDFHTKLETLATSIRKSKKIKGLCYKIEQNKNAWVPVGPPIIPYSEYCYQVKQVDGVSDVTERLIRAATVDLHDMGVIYRVHLPTEEMDDYIVLDPNWLFSTVVGRLFAGTNMPSSQPKLEARKQVYTSYEISEVLQVPNIDVKLLMIFMMHLELAVQYVEDVYFIPAKLPSEMESHIWSQNPDPPCNEIYGRRMQCSEDTLDIYTPTTFPCIQARLMKKYGPHVIPVQNRLKFSANGMSVLVQMTRDKQGIDVIVRGRGEEDRRLCFERVREAVGIIWYELSDHSPGTSVTMLFLSSRDLKECSPLSADYRQVRTFPKQELVEAEKRHAGKVYHDPTVLDRYDQVEDIICLGYDPFFIRHLGLECHSKWIPTSTLEAMDDCLASDEAESDGTCYRFLASALGFTGASIRSIEKRCTTTRSRITPVLINEWVRSKDEERQLGNLRAIIAHHGLVGNRKAVEAFDEMMLKEHDDKEPSDGQLPADTKMPPPDVLASRATFRHFWSMIRKGTRTSQLHTLLQEVLTPSDKEDVEYYMEHQGPMKAADRLAPMLLSKPECLWFESLLQAFELSSEQRFRDIGRMMKPNYEDYYGKFL